MPLYRTERERDENRVLKNSRLRHDCWRAHVRASCCRVSACRRCGCVLRAGVCKIGAKIGVRARVRGAAARARWARLPRAALTCQTRRASYGRPRQHHKCIPTAVEARKWRYTHALPSAPCQLWRCARQRRAGSRCAACAAPRGAGLAPTALGVATARTPRSCNAVNNSGGGAAAVAGPSVREPQGSAAQVGRRNVSCARRSPSLSSALARCRRKAAKSGSTCLCCVRSISTRRTLLP